MQVWASAGYYCLLYTSHPAQIDGLLGWDVLQFGCWQWDEKSQRLSGKPSLPEKSTIHELTGWDSMPVVQAETNGEILCWGFDSGNTSTTGGSLFYSRLPESLPLELETLTGVDGTTQVPAKRLARLPPVSYTHLNYSMFASNEEMYTKLLGGSQYDVLVPSDYMIERMIDENMLQPLDKSMIPNLANLADGVKGLSYDPDNTYSAPYFWGMVGIVYNKNNVDPADVESQGFDVLRNEKYKGHVFVYDSERDSFMMAFKALGYSMNTCLLYTSRTRLTCALNLGTGMVISRKFTFRLKNARARSS